jgi:hypothetical protein
MSGPTGTVRITIMALLVACTQLSNELDLLSQHLRDFAATKSPLNASERFTLLAECLLEGLLSRVWQAWCNFCRSCIIQSCMGTVTGAGNPVAGLPAAISETHVSGAAVRAKQHRQPFLGVPNGVLRIEPTWGDVDILARTLPRLRPTNSAQLLAAFSTGYPSAKALQIIRNAAAHNHAQTLGELHALRSAYVVFPIGHPTHALFWIEHHSSDFLLTGRELRRHSCCT